MNPTTRRALLAAVVVLEIVLLAVLTYAGAGSPMAGIAVRRGTALIEADNQTGVMDSIRVVRVVAPAASWIVVRLDANGAPGMPVGTKRVPAGTTTAAEVKLASMGDLTPALWISLFADGGTPGVFEANMADMATSRDKPYVVDGREVVARVGVAQVGASARKGSASVTGATLTTPRLVTIASVTVPDASWAVVEFAAGTPRAGAILGIAPVAAGTETDVLVPLSSDPAGDAIRVSLRRDAGKLGRFDLADDDVYRVGAAFVTAAVRMP